MITTMASFGAEAFGGVFCRIAKGTRPLNEQMCKSLLSHTALHWCADYVEVLPQNVSAINILLTNEGQLKVSYSSLFSADGQQRFRDAFAPCLGGGGIRTMLCG